MPRETGTAVERGDRGTPIPKPPVAASGDHSKQIPALFQLLLGLYIVLTSSFPTIVQGAAFGVQGGAGYEFEIAMTTAIMREA